MVQDHRGECRLEQRPAADTFCSCSSGSFLAVSSWGAVMVVVVVVVNRAQTEYQLAPLVRIAFCYYVYNSMVLQNAYHTCKPLTRCNS